MKSFMVLLSAALLANHVQANAIFFPDNVQLVFTEPPECARNPAGICSNASAVNDYPTDLVRQALGRAGDAALSEITRGDELVEQALGDRFGGSIHDDNHLLLEQPACVATEEIIFPTMAMNDKREWLYVANVDSMSQGIRVEKCLDEGKPCKIDKPVRGKSATACRQKYIYRKLIAIDASQNLQADNFRIPSTCVCYIKNDYFLNTRFGHNSTKSSAGGSTKRRSRSSRRSSRSRRRPRRQADGTELQIIGDQTEGLSGSPLDSTLSAAAPDQGTAQQTIETERTLNPSDIIGSDNFGRYAGEIIVESNPIVVQKKPPKPRRRN